MNPSLIVFELHRAARSSSRDTGRTRACRPVLEAQQAAQAPTPTDREKPPA